MSEEQIVHKLPQKLPPESRKRLTLENLNPVLITKPTSTSVSSHTNEDEENYNYGVYNQPIDQPSLPKESANMASNQAEIFENQNYFPLSNGSDSETTDAEDRDSYFCLDSFNSTQNEIVDKGRKLNPVLKSIHTNEHEIVHELDLSSLVVSNSPCPAIPPKLDSTGRKLSLCSFNTEPTESTKCDSLDEEMFQYIKPSESVTVKTIDQIRNILFVKKENRKCADCKSSHQQPNWISCVYFITLCDSCAEIHMKLSHTINKFYLMEIKKLYEFLTSDEGGSFCDLKSFVYILNEQAGNEKINSLLQFCKSTDEVQSSEKLIKEKYLSKRFINKNDLDTNANYLEDLNRNLFNYCVTGPCIPVTIYNLFLGANVNYVHKSQTPLDNALRYNQKHQRVYLRFNNARTFDELDADGATMRREEEFIGEAYQIIDLSNRTLNKSKIILKLTNDEKLLFIYLNKQTQLISLSCLLSIAGIVNDSIVELKWFNRYSSTVVSTYLEFYNGYEKQLWLRKFNAKMTFAHPPVDNNDPLDVCHINSLGYFSQCQIQQAGNTCDRVLVTLVETLDSQIEKTYRKLILISSEESRMQLDVRKLVRLRCENETLTLDVLPVRSIKLKSVNGDCVTGWYERLFNFAQLKFRTLEEQYLNKDDCPLVVDKLCAYVEVYYLTERNFYAQKSSTIKSFRSVLEKLQSDRSHDLAGKRLPPSAILNLFQVYFAKYLRSEDLNLIAGLKLTAETRGRGALLFSILKRIISHLLIIAKYESLNQHSLDYLTRLFGRLMSGAEQSSSISDGDDLNLTYYALNCERLFNLDEEFFRVQTNIVEKLLLMKETNTMSKKNKSTAVNTTSRVLLTDTRPMMRNFLVNVYVDESRRRFFQIMINAELKTRDVLLKCPLEFGVVGKGVSLFETIDGNRFNNNNTNDDPNTDVIDNILLERALPIDALLAGNLHDWSAFNLVLKQNYIKSDCPNAASFFDNCLAVSVCDRCVKCLLGSNMASMGKLCLAEYHKKWRHACLSVQNAMIRVYEKFDSNESVDIYDCEKKLLFEAKIEDCLVYYGLYESQFLKLSHEQIVCSAETNAGSLTNFKSSFNTISKLFNTSASGNGQVVCIDKENCITFYHLKTKSIHSVHLNSKQAAYNRYASLFKLAYYPADSWSF